LELILVCALLALLVAIVWPNLEFYHADVRITAGADMVKGRLAEARSRAVEEGKPYRFEIIDANRCRVVSDIGDAPPAAPPGQAPPGDSENGTPGEDSLPKMVSFDLGQSSANGPDNNNGNAGGGTKIVFLPDGSARDDAEIRLTSQGARPVVIRLRALTGTITTVRPTEGNGS
jgi:Tfp pilus assembly protein FimT